MVQRHSERSATRLKIGLFHYIIAAFPALIVGAVALQIAQGVPLSWEIGPTEYLELGFLALLGGFCVFSAFRRYTPLLNRCAWQSAAVLAWSIGIIGYSEILRGIVPETELDFPGVLGWALAGAGLRLIIRFERPRPKVSLCLIVGYCLQSFAVLSDLIEGTVLQVPGSSAAVVGAIEQICDVSSVAAYCIGFALLRLAPSAKPVFVDRSGRRWAPGDLWTVLHYATWRLRHPNQPFSAFYVADAALKSTLGLPHPTLGRNQSNKEKFRSNGRVRADFLIAQGLRPHHRCVDFGCGSLRVGRHLIEYLAPERYLGLDVTDVFYLDGLRQIDPMLLAEKKPHLTILSDVDFGELESRPPDFLICTEVVQHVAPEELKTFLTRIVRLTGPHTRSFISLWGAPRMERGNFKNWHYTVDDFKMLLSSIAPSFAVRQAGIVKPGKHRQKIFIEIFQVGTGRS